MFKQAMQRFAALVPGLAITLTRPGRGNGVSFLCALHAAIV
jgi:hypothetical protein